MDLQSRIKNKPPIRRGAEWMMGEQGWCGSWLHQGFQSCLPQYSHGQTDRAGTRGAESWAGLTLPELLGSKVYGDTPQLEAMLLYQWKITLSSSVVSVGKRRGEDAKPGSSTVPSPSFLIKTNREGKRENYTKLTAVAFGSYQYSSWGDQETDRAHTPPWYSINHLLDSQQKQQYPEL